MRCGVANSAAHFPLASAAESGSTSRPSAAPPPTGHILLSDFGVSKQLKKTLEGAAAGGLPSATAESPRVRHADDLGCSSVELTTTRTLVGTPEYVVPEVLPSSALIFPELPRSPPDDLLQVHGA